MKKLEIHNNIKKLRKRNNITQKELAEKLRITTSSVGMYERGARKPSIEVLIKTANYFDISIDCLLFSKNLIDFKEAFKCKQRYWLILKI
ncbi:MAG TPA: helix-turn-helix transcriptional regulator [Halanaerobiales bacterium]|nr:helix-turn-helix transcriptional regulator [Halanaerobiales bacterium]